MSKIIFSIGTLQKLDTTETTEILHKLFGKKHKINNFLFYFLFNDIFCDFPYFNTLTSMSRKHQINKMDAVYENSAYTHSTFESRCRCAQY